MTASTVATSDATTHAIANPGRDDGGGDAALRPPMETDRCGALARRGYDGIREWNWDLILRENEIWFLALVFGVCRGRLDLKPKLNSCPTTASERV
jgi:hypothetical protein